MTFNQLIKLLPKVVKYNLKIIFAVIGYSNKIAMYEKTIRIAKITT